MFATMLVALALAGAPASTPVVCNPGLQGALGLTYSDTATITPDGRAILGVLNRISLGPTACGALLYTSASAAERAAIRRLNVGVDFDQLVGVGLQVALHESNHVALNSQNECLVEKATRVRVDELLERLADAGRASQAEAEAEASDAALPAQYHGC